MKLKSVITIIAVLQFCGISLAETISIDAAGDTEIRSGSPTTNYNSATSLYVGEHTSTSILKRRSLIKFDLSVVPEGSVITSAKLYLKLMGNSFPATDSIDVYQATDAGEWSETTATWNTQVGWNLVLAENDVVNFAATPPYVYYNWNIISTLTRDQVVTFELIAKDESCTAAYGATFWRSEDTTAKPYLEVEYSSVPEPATMILLGFGALGLTFRKK